jgi:predicted nucleic-acid-binding protein
MRIVADTNILVRIIARDDARQAARAEDILKRAEIVAVPIVALCELNWVLSRLYKKPAAAIAMSIRLLIESANVETDRVAAASGLTTLDSGGDFADGAIATEGRRLGGETFVSFDKRAVKQLAAQGVATQLLA